MADQINAPCRRDYTAAHDSGTRKLTDITWIVLHDEEASSAASAAAWFENPRSGGSAHLCVDDTVCYRTLPNTLEAWGVPGTFRGHSVNSRCLHIEQAGFAKWSLVLWKKHLRTLQRAAWKTAYHCHLFGIPPTFVFAAGLKLGHAGVTTHAECTKAFHGDHRDPGLGWPRPLFMLLVRRYYAEISL